jgi:hypothetical protein
MPKITTGVNNATLEKLAAPVAGDRLLTAAEVHARLGLRCKTSHSALRLAKAGRIELVRLGLRVVRFRESSVDRLIRGEVAA